MLNSHCPNCGEPLEKGDAIIHGTARSFFLLGFSIQHLFFKSGSRKEIRVLKSGTPSEAWRCKACELLLLKK